MDRKQQTDIVYNYGTFEFGPDFYTKFIQAKLLYTLSFENYNDFVYEYQYDNRSVIEQVLNLTCLEKNNLYKALQINALPQNRSYKYDFLYDNCTTRAGNIIITNTNAPVHFGSVLPNKPLTFRDMIHIYLNSSHQYWSKLGIDILLGANLDKKVNNKEAMFLPDYLMTGFNTASTAAHPLVLSQQTVLQGKSPDPSGILATPWAILTLIFLLVVIVSLIHKKWALAFLSGFDFLFFFVLGLSGLLLLFMWFGREDNVCRNNFNLLWALPLHVVMAFYVRSNQSWAKKYFKLVFWLTSALVVAWFFLPQQMNNALIPVLLLILYRSFYISKKMVYAGKTDRAVQ